MSLLTKIYLLLISILFSMNAYAGLFDSKLRVYECENEMDANACNSSCKKTSMDLEFKVDKKQNKIFRIVYYDGKQRGSSIYETSKPYTECSIFDDKNWSCSKLIPASRGYSGVYETTTMANGMVAMQTDYKSFKCAK